MMCKQISALNDNVDLNLRNDRCKSVPRFVFTHTTRTTQCEKLLKLDRCITCKSPCRTRIYRIYRATSEITDFFFFIILKFIRGQTPSLFLLLLYFYLCRWSALTLVPVLWISRNNGYFRGYFSIVFWNSALKLKPRGVEYSMNFWIAALKSNLRGRG